MKKKLYITLFIGTFFISVVYSQVLPPPVPPPPPPGLPIDGGLLFLFLSGLIYGIKKIKD
jgi:hypothetical protein